MMSPRRLTAMAACWNSCHSPTSRSIGCDRRLANIWNATSMPMVKPSFFITIQAPMHRIISVSSCSRVLAAAL